MKSKRHILSASKSDGFTLIELTIVLVVLGIAVGLAGLYIGKNSAAVDLKKFTREVSAVMRYARNHAVTEKKIYCLVIDRDEQMLRLYSEDTDYSNVTIVIEKEIPEMLEIGMQGNDSESTFVEFFPGGNTTGGVMEIVNVNGSRYFIIVNRITGKLTLEKDEE